MESDLASVIRETLAIDCRQRPSARALRIRFARNRSISVGNECMKELDHRTAIEAFETARAIGEIDTSSLTALGDACKALHLYEKGIEAYNSAIAENFYEASALINLGCCLHATSDYDRAITIFERAQLEFPEETIRCQVHIGDAYVANGDVDNGIRMYAKVIKKEPANELTIKSLASAYLKKGEIDRAIKCLTAGIKVTKSEALMNALVDAAMVESKLAKESQGEIRINLGT